MKDDSAMLAITVLMRVAGTGGTAVQELQDDSAVESVARLCILPAQGLGLTHPHRLRVLIAGLLAMAQGSLRMCPTGGTVFARVRYLGEGAFGIDVQIQTQEWATSDNLQEVFSGVVMNLEDEGAAWTYRTGKASRHVVEEAPLK